MKVYRMKKTPQGPGAHYGTLQELLHDVELWFSEEDPPFELTISIEEMTQAEWDELPEFKGY